MPTKDQRLHFVSGYVTDRHNNPIDNLVIRIFDKDLRSEELIGETSTKRSGKYELWYDPSLFLKAEKRYPDLAVKVYDATGNKLLKEPSMEEVKFNAKRIEHINIQIHADLNDGVDEFTRYVRSTDNVRGEITIDRLDENKEVQDITFLSRECNIPQAHLQYLVLSHRLEANYQIPSGFFYGLFRMETLLQREMTEVIHIRYSIDLDTEPQRLLYDIVLLDEKVISRDIKKAASQKIIPADAGKKIKDILAALNKYRNEAQSYYFEEKPKVIYEAITDFILNDKIAEVSAIFQSAQGDFSKFLSGLNESAVFSSKSRKLNAEVNLRLGEVLGFESELLDQVKTVRNVKKPEDVKKLVHLEKEEWAEILSNPENKITRNGKNPEKKLIDFHARTLEKNLEVRYPAETYIKHLNKDTSPLNGDKAVASFFVKHTDADLKSMKTDLYFSEKKLDPAKNAALIKDIKKHQRLFKLTSGYTQAKGLLENNIHSAQGIIATGKSKFLNEVAPRAGMLKSEAISAYKKAEDIHAAATLVAGDLQAINHAADIHALANKNLKSNLVKVGEDFPNLKSLFQLTDLCECEHCRSVYSPAAYMVELLQFLDKRDVVDTTTIPHTTGYLAKDKLFERRPDLGDLDLNCDNANTPIPYIDLVCEILEEQVSPDPGINFTGSVAVGAVSNTMLTALQGAGYEITDNASVFPPDSNGDFIIRDKKFAGKIHNTGTNQWNIGEMHQTYGKAEELSAAPYYVNQSAYTVLNTSTFAFNLPFDLAHAEAKAYFNRFGVSRAEMMRDFQVSNTPTTESIAAEKIGLTDQERIIITSPDAGNQKNYWNTSGTNPINEMEVVDTFLEKSNITYPQLINLLELKFVRGSAKLFIKHLDNSCDTHEKIIENLNTQVLDRMHRFLRLWRKLNWSFETLNEIISQPTLGNGSLNNATLINIALLMEISEKTGIKPDELTGCYGTLPHTFNSNDAYTPLYHEVFLNKAKNGVTDEGLKPENIDGTQQLVDFRNSISVALGITEEDFDRIVATLADTLLSWNNISRLYAVSKYCQKQKKKIVDFIALETLTGNPAFDGPPSTHKFITRADYANRSPFALNEVLYLLRHEAYDLELKTIKTDKIEEILLQIQLIIQESYLNHQSPYNDELTSEELQGELKNLLLLLPLFDEEIANDFVRMSSGNWNAPPDPAASAYIDEHLSGLINTTPVKSAQAAIAPGLENEKKAFIKNILDAVTNYLYEHEKKKGLTGLLSEVFKQDEEMVEIVLAGSNLGQPAPGTIPVPDILLSDAIIDKNNPDVLPVIDEASYPDHYKSLRLLQKLLSLWAGFELTTDDLEWWIENAGIFTSFEADKMPYEAGHNSLGYAGWEQFVLFQHLAKNYPPVVNMADAEEPYTFRATLEMLSPGSTTSTLEFLDQLSGITGYDRSKLTDLDMHFGWSTPNLNAYRDPVTWLKLENCYETLHKVNLSLNQAKEVIKPQLLLTDAAILRAALKTRYSEDLWLETLREIMDVIRPAKRDALVNYLLATNTGIDSQNDLYDYFLVDVEMEACMPSSRIVQAHGVIQLFAQRCLLGLEPETAADVSRDKEWEQWKWMRNYRVWEANRKVFLYPENWIEPELLDDKSFLFAELENELLQNELNEFTTEDAIIRYVERLDDISFLEVVATFYETEVYTMHVFARTKGGDPPQYYYRKFESERYWTPWEKVDLDITSDHLLAFKRNDRLHLAWPIFSEEHNPEQDSIVPGITGSESTQESEDTKAQRRLKIQLAISQFANNQWKPKKISQEGITTPEGYTIYESDLDKNIYNFMYVPFGEFVLVFHTWYDNGQEYHTTDGVFNLAGCQGYPELISTAQTPFPDFFPDVKDTWLKKQRYNELGYDSDDNLFILNIFSFLGFGERLGKTPGNFRITHPFQLNLFDIIGYIFELLLYSLSGKSDFLSRYLKLPLGTLFPYFFEDSDHAYVIIPGMYGEKEDDQGNPVPVRRTFSDINQLLMDMIALIKKYAAKWQDDPNQDLEVLMDEFQNDPDTIAIKEELQNYKGLQYKEEFRNLYHPLICLIRKSLYNNGVQGIMDRELQLTATSFNFKDHYDPAPMIVEPYPVESIDFDSDGSYSSYNWELFYHSPLMIANRLRTDQRFEEAMDWYHYMFNPTGTLDGDAPQKYWVTKPFYLNVAADYVAQRIDTLLYKVADPNSPEIKELEFAISEWREKPFRPHTVARFRPVAYQITLLMNYLKNLIDWGDYQFRIDTMESMVQATQLYVLAEKLLGPKPGVVPPVVKPPYQTYNQVEADLDAFGNALVELENLIPDLSALPEGGAELPPPPVTLSSLYFCIPTNDKMLDYWDLVSDRLFKIRNCQNIDGVERTLALFSPPIDPGALVKAAAAGLDISAFIAGMNAPLPHYRFNILASKASELVQEVRGLGNALLQALEKKDAEELALLRNSLELNLLTQMREIKQLQIDEAVEQIEVLNRTKEVTQERNDYYANIERMIPNEQLNLDKLQEGQTFLIASQIAQAVGAILGLIPDFSVGGHGAGGSPAVHATFGGSTLAGVASAASSVLGIFSGIANYQANRASILGGYDRRWEDWKLQERIAIKELEQIDQQIVVAEITQHRNEKDLGNHEIQIENNEKTDDFMRDKYTNKDLYQWMISEISGVYFRAYQLAFDMAKKAEKCYQHELGTTDTFIDFGYWDSMKKGLLAADNLFHDIKRMEVSYLDTNKREYELTKHVSLDMLDPLALTKLKATGSCDFEIPESLYDLDHPGHYFRRIKSVSISIPCIAGPYTSVSGKLSLVSNKYRKNTSKAQGAAGPLEEYQEDLNNDTRFIYNVGTIQSVATSNGQNDSGLFELNFKDERYLPFEGRGAISTWRFELPKEVKQFDYSTIRDLIVHVKYTAREGGSSLRTLAETTLAEKVQLITQALSKTGLHKSVSIRHDLPNDWHLLKTAGETNTLLSKERLPYFAQPAALNASIGYVMFLAKVKGNPTSITIKTDDVDLILNRNDDWQMCLGETSAISLDTDFKLTVADADKGNIEELIMVVKYDFA
jgi:hypothetical protein